MIAHSSASEFDIFISYAHQGDTTSRDAVIALVARLHEELETDFRRRFDRDLQIFFDRENILDFDHWQVRCHRALRSSRFFIACLSRSYLRSDACRWEWEQWCRHELEHGLVGQGAASLWFIRLEDLDTPEDAELLRRWEGDLLQRFHIECREWRLDDPNAFLDAAVRAELAHLTEHVAQRLRILVTERARRGNLPWPNANFVGREPELAALRAALIEQPAQAPAGIHGAGGMGKTALALAFAQREADAFPGGCWQLRCEGRDRLLSVFRTLVLDLDIDLTDEEKHDDAAAVRRVLAVLRARGPAFFMLDNVDRPILLAPEQLRFLEGQSWARLLYTTRLAPSEFETAGAVIRPIDLDRLPEAHGIDLIRRYQPGRVFASPGHEAAAREIVRLLNGLTLAVETAAVYLGQSDGRLAEPRYAADIREYVKKLGDDLERGGSEGAMSQLREVIATMRPTLARLDAPTRTVLQIAALLGAEAIALPWLRAVAGRIHPELAVEAEIDQSDPWTQLVRSLIGMRLFQATPEPRVISIHRILQRVLDAELHQDRQELQGGIEAHIRLREAELNLTTRWEVARWELEPLEALALLWDEASHPDTLWLMNQVGSFWFSLAEWSSAEPMMRRVLAIQYEKLGGDHPLFTSALKNLAGLLHETGRSGEAEPMMRRALAIEEAAFGQGHPRTVVSLNNLAGLLLATNRYEEAEPMMRRALAIGEAEQGSDHLDVARDLNNLAQLLQATNRLPEAEALMRRALAVYRAKLEENHPRMAAQISNLACLLREAGRLGEAEPMLRQALAIDEICFGADHPLVAKDLHNLAGLLSDLNRLPEAEPMIRRALAIDEARYGAHHPYVAGDLSLLGQRLSKAHRLEEAEPMFRRALAIDEASLGANHPAVAKSLEDLAQLLIETNRSAEAEPMMRRALAIDEASYGKDHPDVAVHLNNLAQYLKTTNRPMDAEPMMRRALGITEASCGKEHPKVAVHLGNLALLLKSANRLEEAEPMMRRALAIDEASYGPEHPSVARDLNNLALLLQETRRRGEAEQLMSRALAIVEATYGTDHPLVAIQLDNLGQLLQEASRTPEAEPMMRRALAIREAAYGADDPRVADNLNSLAQVLSATNRLAEAEPMMRRALAIDEAACGSGHPHVARDLSNLAQLLKKTRRPGEAEPMMRRALAIDEAHFGADHPTVAIRLNNLARLLHDAGRLGEAEPMMRRTLAIDEAAFGAHHSCVARDLCNLALLLEDTGRRQEAEPMMRRSLAIDEANLGPDHPDVAIRLNNLALLLKALGRLEEAEPLMRRHLEIFLKFTRVSGHPHPHLQTAVANYTALLEAMGKTAAEADQILEQVAQPYGFSFAPANPQNTEDVSPKLRNVIEKIKQDPSKLQEIAQGLQREDPGLLQELLRWIERLQK